MGNILKLFFITLIFYLVYGLYTSNFNFLSHNDQTISFKHPMGLFDYRGVINVHTKASTGSGNIEEIVSAAQNAKLDFLFITDLGAFPPDKTTERYFENLLIMNDGEYNYLDSRILYLDIKSDQMPQGPGQIQTLIGDHLSRVEHRESEGLFLLSHPLKPGYEWSGPFPPGLNGIEVINLRSIWESGWRKNRLNFIGSLLTYPFNSQLSFLRLIGDLKDEQALWDQLLLQRPTFATVGTDAEAKIRFTKNRFVKFPSYETLFSLASNHVLLKSELTGNFQSDKTKLLQAIATGQFYMSFDMISNPKGFNVTVKSADDTQYLMGSKISMSSDLNLEVSLPETFATNPKLLGRELIVLRNGKEIARSNDDRFKYLISEPGIYRVIVKAIPDMPFPNNENWLPWILSNPFYIQ